MPYQGHALSVFDDPEGTARLVSETNGLPIKAQSGTLGLQVKLGQGDLVNDAWGVQKISKAVSMFHGMFTFDIPATMWFMYENDVQVYTSTNITSVNGHAKLLTDVTNTDLILESRECPRYQPNRGHLFSTALWCPNKTNDGIRKWGLKIEGENGVYFKLKSDGLLYACLLSGGVETHEELIDTSGLTGFDAEKGNIYDIQYQWRGVGSYFFYIGNPETGASELVHTLDLLGTLTNISMQNPALPAHFHCVRTTEDVEMNIGCADITSENGLPHNMEQYGSAYAEGVTIQNNTPVIVLHNPLQISGVTNTRTLTLARISFNCSKKATFKVWATRNLSDITGATFQALGSGSFVETDSTDMDATAVKATSATIANMKFITTVTVEALTRISIDNPYRDRIEFPIVRGDYLVVTGTSASGNADVVIEWGEQI